MTVPVTAPDTIGKYELYRVVTDFDALHEGFRDRVEELQITRIETDAAGHLQPGYSAKLLCNPPIKSFGRSSLPGMLRATGMALVLVIDDERFAPVKERLSQRKRPVRAMVRRVKPKWLFSGQKAVKCGKKRWEGVPAEARTNQMKRVRTRKKDRNQVERERIAAKRAADPAYRERERVMVRKRMAKLRATPGYVRPDSAAARKAKR
jgi:hypothetical protein